MVARRAESRVFVIGSCVVVLLVAALFYGRALALAPGIWPAPLDDVYIHFDFARAIASGHPFEWIAGQGFSSGETSPGYAWVLGVGYLIGFRGERLGVWAAFVACVALVVMMLTLRDLTQRVRPAAPWWTAPLACSLLLVCGTLDFAWFSGMEVALFGAVAALLLRAVDVTRCAEVSARARAQWLVGALGAALVLVRPESVVVVAVSTFLVARRVGSSSPVAACIRVACPGALTTFALLSLNRVMTGDAASAGALLKLLASNPFATDENRARDYLVGLATFVGAMRHDLGDSVGHFAYLLPALACASLCFRRTRALGLASLGGALSFVLLVSTNGAARFQNLRDYMPAMALVTFAAALGAAALTSHRSRYMRALGAALGLAVLVLAAPHVAQSSRFFARACRNIRDQQVTVGRRLAVETSDNAILLVGDAGAIPYLAGRHAVDALGLGGYHRVPFVHAAVQGEAATLELIERLPLGERPTVLALYPNWFPGITGTFGHETGHVTITDNVMCGGVTKVVYDADWSTLRAPGDGPDEVFEGTVLDELDVADVVSEAAHGYLSPAPRGGWTLFSVRTTGTDVRRFDAGRVIPEGQEESFVVQSSAAAGATLVLRVDETTQEVRLIYEGGAAEGTELRFPDGASPARWALARAVLPAALSRGARLHLQVRRGTLHDFHAWLVGGKP